MRRKQHKQDRDPREPIFEFKRRTLVHFAVDTESVFMTTRLAGTATHFLPSTRVATAAPATRPIRRADLSHGLPVGRGAATRQPARPPRALHPPADRGEARRPGPQGQDGVDDLPALPPAPGGAPAGGRRAREGVGHNYLVEHSAGSGKSNTIGWLAHRLVVAARRPTTSASSTA